MGFKMDLNMVYGDNSTRCANSTLRVLKLSLAELSNHQNDWLEQIKFDYGSDQKALIRKDLKVGQIYVIIYDSGRIDRFEVVNGKKIKFFLHRDEQIIFELPDDFKVGQQVVYFEGRKGYQGQTQIRFIGTRIKRIILLYY